MNGKSFMFGKNYDSDYLSGKRLKRKSCGQRNERLFRSKIFGQKDNELFDKALKRRLKGFHKLNAIQRSRKQMTKPFDRRITLQMKGLANNCQKSKGLYANGKAANDCVSRSDDTSKARIKEDLFWILKRGCDANPKPCEPNSKRHETKSKPIPIPVHQKPNESPIYRPNHRQKQTQKNSIITLDDNMSDEDIGDCDSYVDKRKDIFRRLSQTKDSLIGRRVSQNETNCGNIYSKMKSRLNCIKQNDYKRKESIRSLASNKSMPSLPTSLNVVKSLMTSYADERQSLAQKIPQFSEDIALKINLKLKEMSKQSMNQSFGQTMAHNIRKTNNNMIYSIPKSPKHTLFGTEDNDREREEPTNNSVVQYDHNIASNSMVVSQLEPRVGDMLSRILLNISEAFHSLSSKCMDKTFFE